MGESSLDVCVTCGAAKDEEGRHTCACHRKELPPPGNAVCPHCDADPVMLNCRPIPFDNGITVLMVWCANRACRKIFSVSFMGASDRRHSGIVIPS